MKKSKKPTAVAEVLAEVAGHDVPYQKLAVTVCEPNDWNHNKLDPESRRKLTHGMKRLLDAGVPLPPVVVRPHPTKDALFQIIDGFHRWDILRVEGYTEVDAYVLDVDDQTAMILTDTLNYLRGEPDPDLHAAYLHRLLQETDLPIAEASEYLPYAPSEIEAILAAHELEIVTIEPPPKEADPEGDVEGDDAFLVLKFTVAREQAEIVERELARIAAHLRGKNLRGRALEFMAVNSSQTPANNLTGEVVDAEDAKPKKPKKKPKKKPVTEDEDLEDADVH